MTKSANQSRGKTEITKLGKINSIAIQTWNNKTISCLRDWRLSTSWVPNLRPPWNLSNITALWYFFNCPYTLVERCGKDLEWNPSGSQNFRLEILPHVGMSHEMVRVKPLESVCLDRYVRELSIGPSLCRNDSLSESRCNFFSVCLYCYQLKNIK